VIISQILGARNKTKASRREESQDYQDEDQIFHSK
jgi:hypothetical protein